MERSTRRSSRSQRFGSEDCVFLSVSLRSTTTLSSTEARRVVSSPRSFSSSTRSERRRTRARRRRSRRRSLAISRTMSSAERSRRTGDGSARSARPSTRRHVRRSFGSSKGPDGVGSRTTFPTGRTSRSSRSLISRRSGSSSEVSTLKPESRLRRRILVHSGAASEAAGFALETV